MPNARHTSDSGQAVLSSYQRTWLLRAGAILLGLLSAITIVSMPNYMRYVVAPILIFGVLFVLSLLSTDTATSHSRSHALLAEDFSMQPVSPKFNTPFQVYHEVIGDVTSCLDTVTTWNHTDGTVYLLRLEIPRNVVKGSRAR